VERRKIRAATQRQIAIQLSKILARTLKRYGPVNIRLPLHFGENRSARTASGIGVVFQGPVQDSRVARYLESSLRDLNHLLSPEHIVVSSWHDSEKNLSGLEDLATLNILDEVPFGNHAKQIISTNSGIACLNSSNLNWIAKVRVDQKIDWEKLFSFATRALDEHGKHRIFFLSNNSFKYRPFGLSDMFQFGTFSAMEEFWAKPDFVEADIPDLTFTNQFAPWQNVEKVYFTESWLNLRYAQNKALQFSNSVYRDYLRYIKEFTIIGDSTYFNHSWMKLNTYFEGSSEKMIFNRHEPHLLKEWSLSDWLSILQDSYLEVSPHSMF